MRHVALLLACGGPLLSVPVAAAPAFLTPSGKWVVNFADRQCLASRTFNVPKGDLVLGLRPGPTGGEAELLLALSRPRERHLFSSVQVQLDGERIGANGLVTMPAGSGRLAYRISLKAREYARLLGSRMMTIRGGVGSFAFDLVGIASVGRLLDECNADLLASWGLTREQQALQSAYPESLKPASEYILHSDYPRTTAKKGAVGEVQARAAVAADGTVSDCIVLRSSGDAALDEATCGAFVRRAKMRPARGRSGRPMASVFVFSKLWLFPG